MATAKFIGPFGPFELFSSKEDGKQLRARLLLFRDSLTYCRVQPIGSPLGVGTALPDLSSIFAIRTTGWWALESAQ